MFLMGHLKYSTELIFITLVIFNDFKELKCLSKCNVSIYVEIFFYTASKLSLKIPTSKKKLSSFLLIVIVLDHKSMLIKSLTE